VVSRLEWSKDRIEQVLEVVTLWATDPTESKIVRVSALQTLFEIAMKHPEMESKRHDIILKLKPENVPSLTSKIRKLTTQWQKK
jgi:hypothetical protein